MKAKKVFNITNLLGLGVFFLVLATAVFFFLRRAKYATIVLRVTEGDALQSRYGAPIWYLQGLKPGMVQKDIFGKSLISIEKNFYYSSNSSDRVEYLTLKLLTTYDRRSGIYNYEGVPLLVGSYQSLKFKGILLRGVIHRIESGEWRPEKKMYTVEGYLNPASMANQDPYVAETMTKGVQNYLANKFVKGLKIMDSEGTTLLEILEAKKETAYRRFIYQNRLVETEDTERKKVTLKIQVMTEKYGDVYLYRGDIPMKINDNLYLDFWDFGATMTITDFKEI